MIEKNDIEMLARIIGQARKRGKGYNLAEAILRALPIPDQKAAGHTSFVQRVRDLLDQ